MIAVDLSGNSRFQWNVAPKGRCPFCFEVLLLVRRRQNSVLGIYASQTVLPGHKFCLVSKDTQFWMDPKLPVNMSKAVCGISTVYASADPVAARLKGGSVNIFGPKKGSWWLISKSDPRWDANGETTWLVSAGVCPEADAKIKELKAKYGDPPDDIEYGFMKD